MPSMKAKVISPRSHIVCSYRVDPMKKTVIRSSVATLIMSFTLHTAVARDVSPLNKAAGRDRSEEYNIGACRFTIANKFGGRFYVPDHNDPLSQQGIYDVHDTGAKAHRVLRSFGLFCGAASSDEVGAMLGAKRIGDKWLQYDPSGEAPGLTPFDENANPQTVTFKGKNWTGVGLTVDATTGDEERRPRVFSFCLIHNAQALCGDTPVKWLIDPKHNDLWMVKSILQSVVFSDAPAASAVSDPSAPANPHATSD